MSEERIEEILISARNEADSRIVNREENEVKQDIEEVKADIQQTKAEILREYTYRIRS